MLDLVDHAARRRRVLQLDRVADPPQPESADDGRLVVLEADRALDQGDLDRRALRVRSLIRHNPHAFASANSSSLPRSRWTTIGSLSVARPVNVARTTLWGFAEPSDLVKILWIPADSTTARTAAPAMMPVPWGAGFSRTRPAPKMPVIACGIVVPCRGTRIRVFLAA